MKNKSVFRRYFQTCASIILISISFLGVVFLAFASQYFKEDKYKLLSQSRGNILSDKSDEDVVSAAR
ncbi:MAG: hypothetical protein RR276_07175 [Angelakisella sp.]